MVQRGVSRKASREVLGDVRDPQLIWASAGKFPIHQVHRDRVRLAALEPWPPGRAGQPGLVHQQLDLVAFDVQTASEHEIGVHAAVAVGPTGLGMGAADRLG